VDTAKAIAALREKLGMSQQEFARELDVTVTSVSRYENGREPSREVLKKLAARAEAIAGADHLQDLFESKWRASVVNSIEKLPSAGTQRRVPLEDLKDWSAVQRLICTRLSNVADDLRAGKVTAAAAAAFLHSIANLAEGIDGDFQTYITGAVPKRKSMTEKERAVLEAFSANRGYRKEN
jgi:transcriptional regulator with XRE-family HTH domain